MSIKSFETLLNELLTDYRNLAPEEDVSDGSLAFIRFACTASALWGLEKQRAYLENQIFPDTADSATLEHHAWIQELVRQSSETDALLLARLLEVERAPGRGGNKYDYSIWAKLASVAENEIHNPTAPMLTNSGLGNFTASQCIDGDVGTKAWDTDTAVLGSKVSINLGSGNNRSFVKLRLYMSAAGYAGTYKIECYDYGAWQTVTTGFAPTAAGWNEVVWDFSGCYQEWRLVLENAPGAGPDIMDMEWGCASETVSSILCVPLGGGVGTVYVYILSAGGFYGYPSDTLLVNVTSKIRDYQPADVPVANVSILRPTLQFQTIDITTAGDCDTVAAADDVLAYVNSLGIGQALYKSQLAAICIDHGATNAVVNIPASDVVPAATTLLRTYNITVA